MPLVFKDAEKARDAIMASQKKEIAKLYSDWADEIGERAKYYSHKSTASSVVSERQMKELQKMLRESSQHVSNEVYGLVKNNIYTVADEVVKCNAAWLAEFGFSEKGINAAFSSVPDQTVRNLITGQIYDSGWSLSQRIWGDNEATLKDIYQVMAKGLAENKPIYEIAKELESYVRPGAKLSWNLRMKDGVKIYKKDVDYNAQRLARTLVQHGYQQSFLATTKNNPFVSEYIWHSNGSRVCDLCKARDGVHFKKDELPMDHPNGMCVMEPVVAKDMVDQLANWFNSPDGTYPEIDAFAKNFGYTGGAAEKAKLAGVPWYKAKNQVGGNWYNAQKYMESKSGTSASAYWKKYVAGEVDDPELDQLLGFNGSLGKKVVVPKTPTVVPQVKEFSATQKKYLESLGFTPENMPKNFDDWSHKISYEMGSEILHSMGTSWADSHPYQKLMKYYNANLTSANLVNKGVATSAATQATTATTKKVLGEVAKDNIDDYIALANSGDVKAYNKLHELFLKYGYDIDDLVDDMDQLDVDSFMFKEAKKSVMKKAFGSTSTASKVLDVVDDVAAGQTAGQIPSHTTWIRNFKNKQSTDYMLAKEEAQMRLIGEAGKQGIRTYSGSSYEQMNSYLRLIASGADESTAIAKSYISSSQLKATRDATEGLTRAALDEDLILRRGTDVGDLAGLFMSGDFGTNKRSLYHKTAHELNEMFQGAVGVYGGFTSTSGIYEKGFSGDVEVILYAPKGTAASSIMSISRFGTSEGETLLNAGTTVRCVKIEESDGHMDSSIRVFLEILVNP